jgi:hypothetical protein
MPSKIMMSPDVPRTIGVWICSNTRHVTSSGRRTPKEQIKQICHISDNLTFSPQVSQVESSWIKNNYLTSVFPQHKLLLF